MSVERDRAAAARNLHAGFFGAGDAFVRAEHDDEALRLVGREVDTHEMTRVVEQETRRYIPMKLVRSTRAADDDDRAECGVVGIARGALLGQHRGLIVGMVRLKRTELLRREYFFLHKLAAPRDPSDSRATPQIIPGAIPTSPQFVRGSWVAR